MRTSTDELEDSFVRAGATRTAPLGRDTRPGPAYHWRHFGQSRLFLETRALVCRLGKSKDGRSISNCVQPAYGAETRPDHNNEARGGRPMIARMHSAPCRRTLVLLG